MRKENVKSLILLFFTFFSIGLTHFSCKDINDIVETKDGIYQLSSITDTLHYLQIKTDSTFDQWEIPYPIYQFQVGDIDNNGIQDLMVGVIKTTRFDRLFSKRLFIFQNYQGYVRPLWLGSRLSNPLIDFKFVNVNGGARIWSVELDKDDTYQVVEYKWYSFGLDYTKHIKKEISLKEAYKFLNR